MRILFLGGTGNISGDCAALLHSLGHEILVVSRGRNVVPGQYRAIQADRKELQSLRAALAGVQPDVVINFLGYELTDLEIDYALFQGVVRQYVFISSATVYEKPPRHLPITEESPKGNPWWEYAQKKLVCEQWLLGKYRENGFPVTIVRPSHTYSKCWIPNPVSSSSYTFAARLEQGKAVYVPDNGETPWTLTAASDFAVGLAGLAGNPQAIGEAFHITSDEVLTWNQIVAEIAAALGVDSSQVARIPIDFICQQAPQMIGTLKGDKGHPGVFDNSKLKRFVPGFQCRKPFRVGVRESVAWLRAHPEQKHLKPELDLVMD
ncbi:MAG TPA: NAD-dependent epimerase/dehydratase family protein, partial [Clostridia bacterium]|nr:NAD-dependent epimerase/dehydratase family protein [Clostridia bacterium]